MAEKREQVPTITAPGWYCEQCGAGLGEYIACEEPDCGPFRPKEQMMTDQKAGQ